MKHWNILSNTTLALTLCLSLASCSKDSEEPTTQNEPTPPQVTTTTTEETTPESNSTSLLPEDHLPSTNFNTNTGEVTHTSYYHEINTIFMNYVNNSDEIQRAAEAFSTDWTNQVLKASYCELLISSADMFYGLADLPHPEDVAVLHDAFTADCAKIADSYMEMATLYSSATDLSTENIQSQLNTIQSNMLVNLDSMAISLGNLAADLAEKTGN